MKNHKQTKLSVRVQNQEKIMNIIDWCSDNLQHEEWDLEPVHMFKPDYRFHFNCEKTRLQVILQHL